MKIVKIDKRLNKVLIHDCGGYMAQYHKSKFIICSTCQAPLSYTSWKLYEFQNPMVYTRNGLTYLNLLEKPLIYRYKDKVYELFHQII